MSAYLFHADAIVEVLRRERGDPYLEWLGAVPREEQFTSAVAVADLYRGARESASPDAQTQAIDSRVLPAVTVLPFDSAVARLYAALKEGSAARGLTEEDLQIAATALYHGLAVVTASTGRFRRVPGLSVHPLPRRRRRIFGTDADS